MTKSIKHIATEFAENAEAYWQFIGQSDAKSANAKNYENQQLLAALIQQGKTKEALSPLLTDLSPKIRLAAAAALVKSDGFGEAFLILQALANNSSEVISQAAKAVLRCYPAR